MDINNYSNVGHKLTLNPNQVGKLRKQGITNQQQVGMNAEYGLEPVYVLKKQDLAVNHHNQVKGEGGLGSGEELSKRFPNATAEELEQRRRQQIKNAQRKYRAKNRDAYNNDMLKLYHTMKEGKFVDGKPSKRFGKTTDESKDLPYDTPEGWYKYRLEQARIANAKYRAKKRNAKMIKDLDTIIDKELKELWKTQNKAKRGRPSKKKEKSVFDPDSEWYKSNFQKIKEERQKELEETGTIVPYSKRVKLEKPEYPYNIDDKPVADREEYDADATAYKKKREKPKAPPVVSSKKKSPFEPTENIKMEIKEIDEPSQEDKDKKILRKYMKQTNAQFNIEAPHIRDIVLKSPPFKKWLEEHSK